MAKPLNIIFIGLSGSGKGTQVELIKQKLAPAQKTHVISTGILLRALKERDTEMGHRVKKVLEQGGLMPSIVAVAVWLYEVCNVHEDEGMIFEGSPRKILEAEMMDEILTFMGRKDSTKIIFLNVKLDEVVHRLLERGREDDVREAIEGRIAFFKEHVMPLIEYYRSQGRLIEIDGEQDVEKVHKDIVQALGI